MSIFSKIIDKRVSAFQSDLLTKHYEEVQHIYRQMRGWKHDYHNHIQVLVGITNEMHLIAQSPKSNPADLVPIIERLTDYLFMLNGDLTAVDTILKTGNIMVDAILNSKLLLASKRGIKITVKAQLPNTISASDLDLCIIIGNLLDNAIEACDRVENPSERFIRIYIGPLKKMLYISVSNSMKGKPHVVGSVFLSTKSTPNHGLGLFRIDKIVKRYNGKINRQYEDGVFATEVMII